jgi:putative FmdB family regulatory protein
MPTYTYQCQSCDLVFDRFHAMSETVEECEECGEPVKRLLNTKINLKKNLNFGEDKPGTLVKRYIEDVKAEVAAEKRRISTEEYNAT